MHEVCDPLLFSRGGDEVLFANSNVKAYFNERNTKY